MTTYTLRRIRAAALLLTIMVALLAASAPSASALTPICNDCDGGNAAPRTYTHLVTAAERPSFIGWARVSPTQQHYVPNPPTTFQAWRWSGSAWQSTTITYGSAYVYPYATGWSWVWRSSTGWLAIQSNKVIVGEVLRSCSIPSQTDMSYLNNCLGVYE